MKKIMVFIFIVNQFLFSQESNIEFSEGYLPKNLSDAIDYMGYSWNENDKISFKVKDESLAVSELHFNYGMFIRNSWLRHGNPELKSFFYKNGIYSFDDMSSIILTSFHRKLNKKNLVLKKQFKFFIKYSKEVNENENKIHFENFKNFKVGDTLTFKYLRTFIDSEQEKLFYEGHCRAKGILIEKRKTDFNLRIKLIETCDEKGIYIIDFSKKLEQPLFEIMQVNDVRWNFYNDWEPVLK